MCHRHLPQGRTNTFVPTVQHRLLIPTDTQHQNIQTRLGGSLPAERDVLLSSARSPFTGDIKASADFVAAESIYYVNLLVCVVECARCGARLLRLLLLLLLLSGFTDYRPATAFRNESTNHPLPMPNAPNNTQTVLHRLLHAQTDIDSHTHTRALVHACN